MGFIGKLLGASEPRDAAQSSKIEELESQIETIRQEQQRRKKSDKELFDTLQTVKEAVNNNQGNIGQDNKAKIQEIEEKLEDTQNNMSSLSQKIKSSPSQEFKEKTAEHLGEVTQRIKDLEKDVRGDKSENDIEEIEDELEDLREEMKDIPEKVKEVQEKTDSQLEEIQEELEEKADEEEVDDLSDEIQDLRRQVIEDYRELSKEIGKSHTQSTAERVQNNSPVDRAQQVTSENTSNQDEDKESNTITISEIKQKDKLNKKEKMAAIIIQMTDQGKSKKEIWEEVSDVGSRSYFYDCWNSLQDLRYIEHEKLLTNKKEAIKQLQKGKINLNQ